MNFFKFAFLITIASATPTFSQVNLALSSGDNTDAKNGGPGATLDSHEILPNNIGKLIDILKGDPPEEVRNSVISHMRSMAEQSESKSEADLAKVTLGRLYANGEYVNYDPVEAKMYLKDVWRTSPPYVSVILMKVLNRDDSDYREIFNGVVEKLVKDEGQSNKIQGAKYLMQDAQYDKAIKIYRELAREGNKDARMQLALAEYRGTGFTRDQRQGIRKVENLSAEGYDVATKALYSLYFNASVKSVPSSLRKLEKFVVDHNDERAEIANAYISGMRSNSRSEYEVFYKQIRQMNKENYTVILGRIFWENKNAYVYVLQEVLKDKGYLEGNSSSYLDAKTIRAFNKYCKDKDIVSNCITGPISPNAMRSVIGDMH